MCVQIAGLLSDSDNTASDATGDAADGLQLVDGKNAKVYLVASDGKGRCLCTRSLNSLFLDPGYPVVLSATFAAPPADVTAIQVRIPHFGHGQERSGAVIAPSLQGTGRDRRPCCSELALPL